MKGLGDEVFQTGKQVQLGRSSEVERCEGEVGTVEGEPREGVLVHVGLSYSSLNQV